MVVSTYERVVQREPWVWGRETRCGAQRSLPVSSIDRIRRQWRELSAVSIADDPHDLADCVQRASAACPVCGEPATGFDRVAASLELQFENCSSRVIGVWTHRLCLEMCRCVNVHR